MRRLLFFLLFNALTFTSLGAETELLDSSDVGRVMNRLFEYHIDQKQISYTVIERSLKIYLTQFDPTHSYLYMEEAQHYLHPNEQTLHVVYKEYQESNFSTYFTLNDTIKEGIMRARKWREVWESDPIVLVDEAKKVKIDSPIHRTFAVTKKELQKRQKERLLRLIAFLMHELKYDSYEGLENKLVKLCERQIRNGENQYLGINEKEEILSTEECNHQVILRTLKALAYSLDAHTAYYSPEEAYAMKVQLEKGMCGIGVVLREGIDGISVYEILPGGPADKCGRLAKGDTIVEVNGENVRHATFHHVLEAMRGKAGSKLTLGISRKTENFQVDLVRSQIAIEDKRVDVEAEPYGDGVIGKLTLHSFYEGENGVSSEKDLKNAIAKLKEQGPLHGLVLDMRENSGGFLTQAVKVSGLFISSGVVVISKYSDGSIKYFRTVDGQRAFEGPLVVLISKGSASATEIVAQTLQDYGVALVVGDEQTYGKGTIQHQTVTDKKSDSFFKVTVGRYYTVSGRSTQIDGVKSDIVIPSLLHFEEVGESYLDYPLPPDRIAAAFEDPLSDVDPFARKWFAKYYVPSIEPVHQEWRNMLPTLKANSEKRLSQNKNYQIFLQKLQKQSDKSPGQNDLQMDEATNILKDMIYLSSEQTWTIDTQ
ncbi:MAG: PDZ domain-containing protein [Chlamydiales bacterium]|nr:PDZ domain-containing protein [Chlamydiales bacterium]